MNLSFSNFNLIFVFLHFGCSFANNDNGCRQSATPSRARRCMGFESFPRLRVDQSPNFQPRYISAQPRSGGQEHLRRPERPAFQRYLSARKSKATGSSHSSRRLTQGNRPSSNFRPITYNSRGGSINKWKPAALNYEDFLRQKKPKPAALNYQDFLRQKKPKPAALNYQDFLRQKKPTRLGRSGSKPYETITPRLKSNLNDFDNGFPSRENKHKQEISPAHPSSNYRPMTYENWGGSINQRNPAARHYQDFLRQKKPTRLGRSGSKPYETTDPRMKSNPNWNDFDKRFPAPGNNYKQEEYLYSSSGLWENSSRIERHRGIFPRPYPKEIKPRNKKSFEKYNS